MARLEARLRKLEKEVAPNPFDGKQSLTVNVRDGTRCDVALTKALKEEGITLDSVSFITFVCGIHTRPARDLEKHPEWEQLQRLYKKQRIVNYLLVKDKAEWQEYQRATC